MESTKKTSQISGSEGLRLQIYAREPERDGTGPSSSIGCAEQTLTPVTVKVKYAPDKHKIKRKMNILQVKKIDIQKVRRPKIGQSEFKMNDSSKTLLSFCMWIKKERKSKKHPDIQRKFLGNSKAGGCLDPPYDEDDYEYTIQTHFNEVNESTPGIHLGNVTGDFVKDTHVEQVEITEKYPKLIQPCKMIADGEKSSVSQKLLLARQSPIIHTHCHSSTIIESMEYGLERNDENISQINNETESHEDSTQLSRENFEEEVVASKYNQTPILTRNDHSASRENLSGVMKTESNLQIVGSSSGKAYMSNIIRLSHEKNKIDRIIAPNNNTTPRPTSENSNQTKPLLNIKIEPQKSDAEYSFLSFSHEDVAKTGDSNSSSLLSKTSKSETQNITKDTCDDIVMKNSIHSQMDQKHVSTKDSTQHKLSSIVSLDLSINKENSQRCDDLMQDASRKFYSSEFEGENKGEFQGLPGVTVGTNNSKNLEPKCEPSTNAKKEHQSDSHPDTEGHINLMPKMVKKTHTSQQNSEKGSFDLSETNQSNNIGGSKSPNENNGNSNVGIAWMSSTETNANINDPTLRATDMSVTDSAAVDGSSPNKTSNLPSTNAKNLHQSDLYPDIKGNMNIMPKKVKETNTSQKHLEKGLFRLSETNQGENIGESERPNETNENRNVGIACITGPETNTDKNDPTPRSANMSVADSAADNSSSLNKTSNLPITHAKNLHQSNCDSFSATKDNFDTSTFLNKIRENIDNPVPKAERKSNFIYYDNNAQTTMKEIRGDRRSIIEMNANNKTSELAIIDQSEVGIVVNPTKNAHERPKKKSVEEQSDSKSDFLEVLKHLEKVITELENCIALQRSILEHLRDSLKMESERPSYEDEPLSKSQENITISKNHDDLAHRTRHLGEAYLFPINKKTDAFVTFVKPQMNHIDMSAIEENDEIHVEKAFSFMQSRRIFSSLPSIITSSKKINGLCVNKLDIANNKCDMSYTSKPNQNIKQGTQPDCPCRIKLNKPHKSTFTCSKCSKTGKISQQGGRRSTTCQVTGTCEAHAKTAGTVYVTVEMYMNGKKTRNELLAGGKPLQFRNYGNLLTIFLPKSEDKTAGNIKMIICMDHKGMTKDIQ